MTFKGLRKYLSFLFIVVGIVLIIMPIYGNIYTKHKQKKMIENWMGGEVADSISPLDKKENTDIADNTEYIQEVFDNLNEEDILNTDTEDINDSIDNSSSTTENNNTNILQENKAQNSDNNTEINVETSENIADRNIEDREGNTNKDSNIQVSNEATTNNTTTTAITPTKEPTMPWSEIEQRMLGMLRIDKINVKIPIIMGTNEEILRVAAGQMEGTGEINKPGNIVLAGHRSYTFGKYFNRLDELESGDELVIETKERAYRYIVYKKHIIEPTDFSITNQSNEYKVLTLFTCHPVAVASHRLVVHALQVEE